MILYLSILIPVYNEEKTILRVLNQIKSLDLKIKYEIIIVNDGSKDDTKNILEANSNLYDKLINNTSNRGKGFSVKEGLGFCNGNYVIFQDADLEYDPEDYFKFISIYDKFKPDLIIGSRLRYEKYTRSHNYYNKIGNFLITNLFNIRHNTTFTDIYSCYLFFKKDLLDHSLLKTYGFEQQAEILKMIVKSGNLFYEIPINYNGRTIKEGKKIRWHSIFKVIYQIIKF